MKLRPADLSRSFTSRRRDDGRLVEVTLEGEGVVGVGGQEEEESERWRWRRFSFFCGLFPSVWKEAQSDFIIICVAEIFVHFVE